MHCVSCSCDVLIVLICDDRGRATRWCYRDESNIIESDAVRDPVDPELSPRTLPAILVAYSCIVYGQRHRVGST